MLDPNDLQKLLQQGGAPPAQGQSQVQGPQSKIPPEVVIDYLEMAADEIPVSEPKRVPYKLFKDKKDLSKGTLEYTDGVKVSYGFLKNNHIQLSAESTDDGLDRMIEELARMMKTLNMGVYVKLHPANNDPKILEVMEKACEKYGLKAEDSPEEKDTKTKVIAEEVGSKTPTIKSVR
jgi:hypothetical protein